MTPPRKTVSVATARLDDAQELLRLYAWIASLFFATGFLGYFIVHPF
jgi:hypothetical protein